MTFLLSGNKKDCCGCSACVNICNHSAISMIADEEGFMYPQKNDNCINCGLCEKVCPYTVTNQRAKGEKEVQTTPLFPKTYAAYSEKDRKESSSGGIFYTIAKKISHEGGVVYGAAFDDNLTLIHTCADNVNDLSKLRGSKYVQSSIGNTFREIRDHLKAGTKVFFVGTPCQVAGLKSFLRGNDSFLLTADIVCHGVPSQWLFNQHVKYLENKYRAKLISYQFRDNRRWGGCEIADFINPNKRVINPTYELSPYLYSFMYGMTFRWSCYECPFSGIPRQGDITLGDYWGVHNSFPKINSSGGVSVVLVNNKKGEAIWNVIKTDLVVFESSYEDACRENGNLSHHSNKPQIRDEVYKLIHEQGYGIMAEDILRSPRYKEIVFKEFKKKYFIRPLSRIYKKIFGNRK